MVWTVLTLALCDILLCLQLDDGGAPGIAGAVAGGAVAAAAMDAGSCARFVAALRKLEYSQGRYEPGSLLLAQDPAEPGR